MAIKAIKSNGKATCIYHAIINNNDRTNELYRILNEQGAVSLGIATYYMMMDVANKMHMTVTGDEFEYAGTKVTSFIIHGELA